MSLTVHNEHFHVANGSVHVQNAVNLQFIESVGGSVIKLLINFKGDANLILRTHKILIIKLNTPEENQKQRSKGKQIKS